MDDISPTPWQGTQQALTDLTDLAIPQSQWQYTSAEPSPLPLVGPLDGEDVGLASIGAGVWPWPGDLIGGHDVSAYSPSRTGSQAGYQASRRGRRRVNKDADEEEDKDEDEDLFGHDNASIALGAPPPVVLTGNPEQSSHHRQYPSQGTNHNTTPHTAPSATPGTQERNMLAFHARDAADDPIFDPMPCRANGMFGIDIDPPVVMVNTSEPTTGLHLEGMEVKPTLNGLSPAVPTTAPREARDGTLGSIPEVPVGARTDVDAMSRPATTGELRVPDRWQEALVPIIDSVSCQMVPQTDIAMDCVGADGGDAMAEVAWDGMSINQMLSRVGQVSPPTLLKPTMSEDGAAKRDATAQGASIESIHEPPAATEASKYHSRAADAEAAGQSTVEPRARLAVIEAAADLSEAIPVSKLDVGEGSDLAAVLDAAYVAALEHDLGEWQQQQGDAMDTDFGAIWAAGMAVAAGDIQAGPSAILELEPVGRRQGSESEDPTDDEIDTTLVTFRSDGQILPCDPRKRFTHVNTFPWTRSHYEMWKLHRQIVRNRSSVYYKYHRLGSIQRPHDHTSSRGGFDTTTTPAHLGLIDYRSNKNQNHSAAANVQPVHSVRGGHAKPSATNTKGKSKGRNQYWRPGQRLTPPRCGMTVPMRTRTRSRERERERRGGQSRQAASDGTDTDDAKRKRHRACHACKRSCDCLERVQGERVRTRRLEEAIDLTGDSD